LKGIIMKRLSLILALGTALSLAAAGFAVAEEESDELNIGDFSATVAVTSNYVWRGVSQTNNELGYQASVDWNHDSGFYLGVWGSNVNFDNAIIPPFVDSNASVEIDVYGGYAGEIAGFTYDVGMIGYLYPGTSESEHRHFGEFAFSVGYDFDFLDLSTGFYVDPSWLQGGSGPKNTWIYWTAGVGVPIPVETGKWIGDWKVSANTGYYNFDVGGDNNYWHWDAGGGFQLIGFDLDFRYSQTNLPDDPSTDLNEDGDARFVGMISRSF
jgi:uncharacterized protein (TIGR02001 family)